MRPQPFAYALIPCRLVQRAEELHGAIEADGLPVATKKGLSNKFPCRRMRWRWTARGRASFHVRMAELNFKVGDVVTLKSGGPVMTIDDLKEGAGSRKFASCTWFTSTTAEKPCTANFWLELIRFVRE